MRGAFLIYLQGEAFMVTGAYWDSVNMAYNFTFENPIHMTCLQFQFHPKSPYFNHQTFQTDRQ